MPHSPFPTRSVLRLLPPAPSRALIVRPGLMLTLLLGLMIFGGLRAMAQPQSSALFLAVTSIAEPQDDIRSTALLLAGGAADATAGRSETIARTLADMHTLVITIDPDWLLDLGGGCQQATDALLYIAQEIGKRREAAPRAPVLLGIGEGTALARLAAATRPDQFKGIVTQDLHRDLPDTCQTALPEAGRKTVLRWHDAATDAASVLQAVRGVRFYPPAEDSTEARNAALVQAYLALAGTDHAFDTGTRAQDLQDLPITLHLPEAATDHSAADTPPEAFVIFLSGDGGWANFDEEIADRLAQNGLPVIGISTMRYLWQERSPDRIAADMTRIHSHFAARFGTQNVILVGFSLGANVTPFYAPLLPATLRENVLGLALLSPETHTGFEVVMGGWLGQKTGSRDVVAALEALPPSLHVLCLYGRKDQYSACPASPSVTALAFEGGHHLDKNYDRAAEAILGLRLPDAQEARPPADALPAQQADPAPAPSVRTDADRPPALGTVSLPVSLPVPLLPPLPSPPPLPADTAALP
ncbi:alpha/beta fold hydrolase [Thioclava sp. GXIMD4216]|uniref:alpha/beta fold hydrolase n=1 Tax=Thioclava sp. GXIMD4216 TaxID=3131929 RepID=UPI0030D2601B